MKRERKVEDSPAPITILGPDASAVGFDEALADGEAETRAAGMKHTTCSPMDSKEFIKDVL